MKNFWNDISKPLIVLAPMADVTDVAFRKMIAKYGKPDVMWTEFVSADGLALAPKEPQEEGKMAPYDILVGDLRYDEGERPIVAQIFSGKPEHMEKAAKIVQDLGFNGLDINMGCPVATIQKQECGASLTKESEWPRARALIRAAKKGAPKIPVSVKTRLGYNHDSLDEGWLEQLLAEEPAVVTLHARTKKEMSKVPAHWDRIKRAVEIRDSLGSHTLIIGNGDVETPEQAIERTKETGCDGVMIGRGIFGKPWLFKDLDSVKKGDEVDREVDIKDRLEYLVEHTKLFEQHLGYKNFAIMKKHYKAYCEGFPGAKELRITLMEARCFEEVRELVKRFKID